MYKQGSCHKGVLVSEDIYYQLQCTLRILSINCNGNIHLINITF